MGKSNKSKTEVRLLQSLATATEKKITQVSKPRDKQAA